MKKIYFMRFLVRFLYLFPIKKNRIVLTAYNGRQYSCSPKYITEQIDKKEFEVIYALDKKNVDKLPKNVKRVNYKSLKHFYYLMTAKCVVFNSTGFISLLPYRKNQIIINTWHGGGAFKTTGISHFNSKKEQIKRKIIGDNITYFISSSKIFSEQQSYSMCIDSKKILNIGTPRNDILFKKNDFIDKKVRDSFNIPENYGIILYAPTYRDGPVKALDEYEFLPIDVSKILKVVETKFKRKFVFLFKAHHDMISENIDENSINASLYNDIQELLYVADILITDYSSCMWDFALTKKPGFLYTPDLEEYQKVHKFASPIISWPYPYAVSNEEIVKNILDYDNKLSKLKIDKYFKEMDSYEKGTATEKLISIIKDDIKDKRIYKEEK